MNCAVIRNLFPAFLTLPSSIKSASVSLLIVFVSFVVFLYFIEVVREITLVSFSFDKLEIITSVRPSLKYSCSGSLLIFTKGKTTMEGLSGSGSACGAAVLRTEDGVLSDG